MSFGQVLYVVWSTLCRLVKFYMSTGQLNVVWSSFICLLVNDLGRQASPSQYELGSSGSSEAPPSEVRIENVPTIGTHGRL